jgi:hypothetical protein
MRTQLEESANDIDEICNEIQMVLFARKGRGEAKLREWLNKNTTSPISEFL